MTDCNDCANFKPKLPTRAFSVSDDGRLVRFLRDGKFVCYVAQVVDDGVYFLKNEDGDFVKLQVNR